ncbi:MAG: hypothetical protein ACK5MD_05375 [Flavobacteriales bacterium]
MIRLINILILIVVFFSCKKNTEKNNPILKKDTLSKIDTISNNLDYSTKQNENSLNINGHWVCYKYLSDERIEKKYTKDYAQEISKYSKFEIKNNKLIIGNCIKDTYKYKYATKLKKYEDESTFITYFKPKKDSVEFIGTINTGSNVDCDIFNNYTFYVSDNENTIQYDRGYFFYYKKSNHSKNSVNGFTIAGIPGNNRNAWSVSGTFNSLKSLEESYRNFRKEFPYGSKNTVEIFPKNEEFFDSKNGIIYYRSNGEYKIIKDNPMGKIVITITQNNNSAFTYNYEMQYPEY